jgi:hypothetical protein
VARIMQTEENATMPESMAIPPWMSSPVTESIMRAKYPVMYVACSRRFFPHG